MKNDSNVLKLVLKKKWFDMIASGEKKEEYRELKPYWIKRLFCDLGNAEAGEPVKYEFVTFYLGYAKDRPKMTFKIEGIIYDVGRPEWGAPSTEVFIIKLGERIV